MTTREEMRRMTDASIERGDHAWTREELQLICGYMRSVASNFYSMAVHGQCHPFIEFCGLMMKYVDVCVRAADDGVDFTQASTHSGMALKVHTHDMEYLAEKLDCIFGPILRTNPEARAAFIKGMGLQS